MRHYIRDTRTLISRHRVLAVSLALTVTGTLGVQLVASPAFTQEAAPTDATKPDSEKIARKPMKKVKQAMSEPRKAAVVPALPHPAAALNVCILNRQSVMQQANINVASTKRLNDLRQAAQADINTAQRNLEAEYKALNDEKRLPNDAVFKSKKAALDVRVQVLTVAAEKKRRQIDVTRDEVNRQISVAALPILQSIEKDKACTLLLPQETVLDSNGVTDITGAVIEGMNTQLRPMPFALAELGSPPPQR